MKAIIVAVLTLGVVYGSPVGECPNPQAALPVFLQDSDDCSIYYECSHGQPIKNNCPPGLHFNTANNVCDFPDNVHDCPAAGRKEAEVKQPKTPVGTCPYPQGEYPVYLPDSEDCTIFYECSQAGLPLKVDCPPGLWFNAELDVCDFPDSSGCVPGGDRIMRHLKSKAILRNLVKMGTKTPVGTCPYPQGAYPEFLPDSKSCSIYYECDSQGTPIKLDCPPGLHFNPSRKVCDWPDVAGCTAGEGRKKTVMKSPRTPVGTCPYPQGAHPVYLPDSEDCTIFYECSRQGVPLKVNCPPGLWFNNTDHVCDYPDSSGCVPGGTTTTSS